MSNTSLWMQAVNAKSSYEARVAQENVLTAARAKKLEDWHKTNRDVIKALLGKSQVSLFNSSAGYGIDAEGFYCIYAETERATYECIVSAYKYVSANPDTLIDIIQDALENYARKQINKYSNET